MAGGYPSNVSQFVLGEASARFPEVANGRHQIIKEPNGSVGALLLIKALPESRMVLLIRDLGDIVASHGMPPKEAFFEPHSRRPYDHLGVNLGW